MAEVFSREKNCYEMVYYTLYFVTNCIGHRRKTGFSKGFCTLMVNVYHCLYTLSQWAKSPKKHSVGMYFSQHDTVF